MSQGSVGKTKKTILKSLSKESLYVKYVRLVKNFHS